MQIISGSLLARIKVRTKLVARYRTLRRLFDREHALGRDTLPLPDRFAGNADGGGELTSPSGG
jgi:hypothetical protein